MLRGGKKVEFACKTFVAWTKHLYFIGPENFAQRMLRKQENSLEKIRLMVGLKNVVWAE